MISFNGTWGFVLEESVGAKPTTSSSGTFNGGVITNGYVRPAGVNMTGQDSGTHAGTYVAVYTPDEDHCWSDDTQDPVTVTLTISPKSITGATVTLNTTSLTFNNTDQSVSVSSVKIDGMTVYTYTVSGTTTAKNANTYTVTVTGTNDYTGSASTTWTMERAQINVLTLNTTSKTYTGGSQSVSVASCMGNGVNATYTPSGAWSATNVGTYTVKVTGTGNFQGEKTATWSMGAMYLAIPYLTNTSKTYSGSSQSPTVNSFDGTWETQSGTTSYTDAGTYWVNWNLRDTSNTRWSDGTTGTKSASWFIGRAVGVCTPSVSSLSFRANTPQTFTVSATGTVTVSTTHGTVSISGSTVTCNAGSHGTGTITLVSHANNNYTEATATVSLSVDYEIRYIVKSVNWTVSGGYSYPQFSFPYLPETGKLYDDGFPIYSTTASLSHYKIYYNTYVSYYSGGYTTSSGSAVLQARHGSTYVRIGRNSNASNISGADSLYVNFE